MRLVYDLVPNLAAVNLAARAVLDPQNRLRDYLPVANVPDVRYRLDQVTRVDSVGAVRALGTPSRQIRRNSVVTVQGGLPAVSAMLSLTESDLVRARQMAGLPIADILLADVASAAAATALAVDNTYELLRGQVLGTGGLSIANGEVIQSVNFGIDAANTPTAAVAWDANGATVLADIEAYLTRYSVSSGGGTPGALVTSRKVRGAMRKAADVRALFAANGVTPARISQAAFDDMLEAEFGLPPVVVYDRVIDGNRVLAENKLVLLPAPGTRVGSTTIGVSEQGTQLAAAGVLTASDVPGVNVATLVEDHPVSRHVNADSIGLPVLERPDLLMAATVLA